MVNWRELAEKALQDFMQNPVTAHDPEGPASELAYLANLGGTHVDTVQRVGARLQALAETAPEVLEMGAYFGVVSAALARGGVRVWAQDVSSMLEHPRLALRYESEGITTVKLDDVSRRLPYADARFDALICCEMLEHLPFNTVRLIREMRRIVKPTGFIFLTVPNQASFKRRWQLLKGQPIREKISSWAAAPEDDNWHWREWVASEFQELLRAGGFTQIELGFRHFTSPAHPNPLRRALVKALYRVQPSLMDDIFVFASGS